MGAKSRHLLRCMKTKRIITLLVLVVVILIGFFTLQYLVDAAAMNDFKVTIKQVNVTHIGVTACDVLVTVNFTNPTSQDLPIESASMDVYAADSYIGHSDVSAFTIPRHATAEKQIFLTVLYVDLAHAVLEGLLNNNYVINVTGTAQGYIFYGLVKTTIPFTLSFTRS
jgi:LEA14-like dessication related protein